MRTVQVVEAKATFSSLLAAVEAGEEIAITRRGKLVARLIPEPKAGLSAADVFRDAWSEGGLDIEVPAGLPVDAVDLE